MSRRYTYAHTIVTPEGAETFTAHEWDSFDEARNAVEKGIRDRKIQLNELYPNAFDKVTVTPSSRSPVTPRDTSVSMQISNGSGNSMNQTVPKTL